MNKPLVVIALAVCLLFSAATVNAAVGTTADRQDAARLENVSRFNVQGPYEFQTVYSDEDAFKPAPAPVLGDRLRRPVGSAVSPYAGSGIGESIALTWDDHQVMYPVGRHVSHYWNGLTGENLEVEVHFCYEMSQDTIASIHDTLPTRQTGYNVYTANTPTANWPRGQDIGCALQGADTIGTGQGANLAIRRSGLAVLVAYSRFFADQLGDGSFYLENEVYYQGAQFNCTYDPRSALNTSFIDSLKYKPLWNEATTAGNHSRYPMVALQYDGSSNLITHVVMAEDNSFFINGSADYAEGVDYRTFAYFRKVGDGTAGTWSSGVVIDTVERNFADLVADPWSGRVCVAYSNPSFYGRLLNNGWDKDCWYRESLDYGLTWQPKVDFTNYLNALAGEPHFSMYYEVKALYSSDGNLHVLFQQTPASLDPYFDGYNWRDFNQDIAHWDRNSDAYVRVANGTYMNDDYLTGSINTIHCGFGGDPATYTQFFNLSECDGKLYAVWNQIHPWANYGDYAIQPELLTDCSYTGQRLNMANWEIMMSVAQLSSPTLWDAARHITNTFTPNCGLPGDPDADMVCGDEYKPYVEHYGLDEAGMDLYWPEATLVDMTPDGEPAYSGNFFLNAEYMDDQFPGPGWNTEPRNPNGVNTLNSMKWLRIACVEPVEASQIEVRPSTLLYPTWVELGQASNITVTVINSGNVTLNVSEIGTDDDGGGWLSVTENPTPSTPFQVPAGVTNTATFDITLDASGFSSTAWMDGEVWLKSDAGNFDSLPISIHVLAADAVEPVVWDTVMTHENMFEVYFEPEGECVALAVGNFGELGYGALSVGNVNMDYGESGLECGTRARDILYLISSSPFTIMADDASGTNAVLSQSFNDASQADVTGLEPTPDKGSISGGVTASGAYDSVYTGRFVNRDTTIAFERVVYGPRSLDPTNEIINFVVLHTWVYSGDGQAHNHVTIGNVCDWDVPAENPPNNTSGVSGGGFIYVQGTDTTGVLSCQSHTGRFATEAFGAAYTSAEWQGNNCINGGSVVGVNALIQTLMVDTVAYRDGTPLVPAQPNPLVWWDETAVEGLNADATVQDQAIWMTFKHDYNLAADDTLHYWTVMSTVRDGTLSDLQAQVSRAKCWYLETIRGCDCGCCVGRVGDANGQGTDEPTISDISVLIDAKFITGTCEGKVPCLAEGDTNQSGGPDPTCDDITISDISILIDYLFITGPENATLRDCL